MAISGSIAAYKIAFFVRLLKKAKADVIVIMTESAKDFITPLTLATLSKNEVYSSFFDKSSGVWKSHVEMGLWADVMIVAPASANTIGKMANGICDNLLIATYLSARCPVYVAPAMDLDMYQHPSTLRNISILKENGDHLIDAPSGELASGLSGEGRMAEPEDLISILQDHFKKKDDLIGKNILITSGPTFESIDPVRFIGNHSSGKMGKTLALECASRGGVIQFITGPTNELPEHPNINVVRVKSANEMFKEATKYFPESRISIFAAAVSDYRPKETFSNKQKRNGNPMKIELVENPDIALEMGKLKKKGQINIGFALETDNEHDQAAKKLKKKNFDLVVLNSLKDSGAGFSHDTNKITIFDKDNNEFPFELKSKKEVAKDIIDIAVNNLDD